MVELTRDHPDRVSERASTLAPAKPEESRLYQKLGLRRRFALFFAAIALGGSAILALALWFGHQRAGGPVEGYVIAWLLASLGLAGLSTWIGSLFDDHVAKPILALTNELETRAEADVSRAIDDRAAPHLGALAPAARALHAVLEDTRTSQKRAVAQQTEALETSRHQLETLVQCMPAGVLVLSSTGEVLLSDATARACLGPVGLHRQVGLYVDPAPLEAAMAELGPKPAGACCKVALTRRQQPFGTSPEITCRLSALDDAGGRLGFVALLEAEERSTEPPALTPLAYDFAAPIQQDSCGVLATRQFVVFDTETTGLDPEKDTVVQLSAVRIVNGKIQSQEVFDRLVDPERPIPARTTEIHGITNEMVKGAPKLTEVAQEFAAFCGDAVLVAHNAPFDMGFLQAQARAGGPSFDAPTLCTARLSQHLSPSLSGHTLDDLAERYDVDLPPEARHTALGDALATAEVLLKMVPRLHDRGVQGVSEAAKISAS
ncbi:DNA polymerase III PolC-type [Tritonibacter multivorans]|uniref:DNA-directed DNA polymerase n=1 Tax=Tritonibacter multivorans TaxID=928856 RepID=A0A0P1G214_9RHOB|nr:3'-5' exonuclease [Tritonibacter multivorans]MDA7419553.1 exonuclease domain-containing protein [Tritonibacter multivorans]CUH75695.1 DNA polymerase III PolC-type [Tritonibacter multivorans]SFC62714.1 DNA polymerase-3 subunit epsilon [Tritonibacter multivorans]